jgi:uncharacterized membrane protein
MALLMLRAVPAPAQRAAGRGVGGGACRADAAGGVTVRAMTTGEPAPGPKRRGLRTGRLEAFSDGVFAIAITLLVLDIAVPAGASAHLLRSVAHLWPSYLAYVVSFSTIGAIWLGHNAITEYLERADAGFVRLNLLLLLVVAFLPFPTKLFADFIGEDQPERVATNIYGISLLVTSFLLLLLWRYALHMRLVRPDADDEDIQLLTRRLTPGLVAYLVLIVAGLFVPVVAAVGYLAVALFFIIPFRPIIRLHRRRSPRP